MILRPERVRMRARKPCLRARRRCLGWYVRFTGRSFTRRWPRCGATTGTARACLGARLGVEPLEGGEASGAASRVYGPARRGDNLHGHDLHATAERNGSVRAPHRCPRAERSAHPTRNREAIFRIHPLHNAPCSLYSRSASAYRQTARLVELRGGQRHLPSGGRVVDLPRRRTHRIGAFHRCGNGCG